MTEVEQPPQNGIDLSAPEDDDSSKARPADIEQDMREMERRKRVEAIMGSKLFREELERIVDAARDGGATSILQHLSDIVGVPASRFGSMFKASNCMMPINDIRGVESMGYAKGEKILRCKLAATFRLIDLYGWTQGLGAQITARLKVDQEYFLVNPYGLMYHEITASSLNKVDMQGQIVEQGTTNFGINKSHFVLHSVVHAARPDIRCAIYIGCSPVVAVSSLKTGLLPLTKNACVLGEVCSHPYTGSLIDEEERNKLVRNLGPNSKVMLLTNHGALCCGETIEEAFFAVCNIVQACETQLKLLPVGVDNLVLIPEESRKVIYDQSRRPPEDLEKKFAAAVAVHEPPSGEENVKDASKDVHFSKMSGPKWRVGGAEFEALMRMLDNAGYRTGYIYRHPLIKSEPPKPKNDVELPPAVSSLGYLLEEEELFRQGIWKRGDLRKGGDRSRWLNSPNVYQKVEVLETGTPDPKKITKWVAEGSPTHSTPVRIEDPLQFVPAGTNPKEFKRLQQQIKDNRRADKISAGPQSHILEGVTWDEANRIKDATVSSAGDHVVLMGAASKGIIQRGYQHNATVYKAPYAKNPFDNVTDDELNEYKRTVERKKKSIHGEYTDTDFSESEPLSSLQTSGAQQQQQQTKQTTTTTTTTAAISQSEPEDVSEHQVMRIETQQAPIPSQPEVVLSDEDQASLTLTHDTPIARKSNRHSQTQQQQQHHYHHHHHRVPYSSNHHYNRDDNAIELSKICKDRVNPERLREKYSFLYKNHWTSTRTAPETVVYMIHKIEIFPHYTYPTMAASAAAPFEETPFTQRRAVVDVMNGIRSSGPLTAQTMSPYRTVSHYGFNYPLTYLPTIPLHPANFVTPVELQRQKVIAFIKRLNQEAEAATMAAEHNGRSGSGKKVIKKPKDDRLKVTPVEIEEDEQEEREEKAGKEDKDTSYDVSSCKPLHSTSTAHSDSFISVKEIQLEAQRHRRRSSTQSQSKSGDRLIHEEEDRHGHADILSERFSSLLSMSGTYPAASHSHSGDLMNDHEHDHDRDHDHDHDHYHFTTTDSGDNCSSFGVGRNSRRHTDNLYRSYLLRNFVPLNGTSDATQPQVDQQENCQHKPEAEQAFAATQHHRDHRDHDHDHDDDRQQQQQRRTSGGSSKHITLTLNSLKRRASFSNADGEQRTRCSDRRHDDDRRNGSSGSEAVSTATTSTATSIEIHINVSIRNSDCARSLQTHEQEFKTKLEKVIDDEINVITKQLAAEAEAEGEAETEGHPKVAVASNRAKHATQRCMSAPESLALCTRETSSTEADHQQRDQHDHPDDDDDRFAFNGSAVSSPVPLPQVGRHQKLPSLHTLRYRQTLALLEHELEMLLNGIIRNMCDCKSKISQISEDIRTATLHVGSLTTPDHRAKAKRRAGCDASKNRNQDGISSP